MVTPPKGSVTAESPATEVTSRRSLSDYERGVLVGLQQALVAVDGHGFHDPPQARIRRLLACDECGHAPVKHIDGRECCERVMPKRPGLLAACDCIEYEPRAFLYLTDSHPPLSASSAQEVSDAAAQ